MTIFNINLFFWTYLGTTAKVLNASQSKVWYQISCAYIETSYIVTCNDQQRKCRHTKWLFLLEEWMKDFHELIPHKIWKSSSFFTQHGNKNSLNFYIFISFLGSQGTILMKDWLRPIVTNTISKRIYITFCFYFHCVY